METTLISNNDKIVPQNAFGEVENGDYPTQQTISLASLQTIVMKINKFTPKGHSLELLLLIATRYQNDNLTSTVYSLTEKSNIKNIMVTYKSVKRLAKQGLIEVLSAGRYNSKSYGPTPAGLAALRPLCNV